jgi:hypothetical protein
MTYLMGSSLSIRMTAATQVGYGVSAATATLVPLVLLLTGSRVPRRVLRVAVAAVGVAVLYLVPAAILPQGRTLLHVAVDFSTWLVPIGFLVTGSMVPGLFRRILDPRWILLFVLVTLYAPLIVQDPNGARLFMPPDISVVAMVATLAVTGRRGAATEAAGAGSFLLVVMSALSGSRSIALLAGAAFMIVMLANRTARLLGALALIAALAVTLTMSDFQVGSPPPNSRLVPATRLLRLLHPTSDMTALGRLNEAGMVVSDMREQPLVWTALGRGHGAVFEPEDWPYERSISEEGFVHNIHMGPVMMAFRFGIAGIVAFFLLAISSTATCWRLFAHRKSITRGSASPAFLYALGTALFMVGFLARNVLPNPMFSFFLAGYICTRLEDRYQPDDPPHQ